MSATLLLRLSRPLARRHLYSPRFFQTGRLAAFTTSHTRFNSTITPPTTSEESVPTGIEIYDTEQLDEILEDEEDDYTDDDTTALGHWMLTEQRKMLYYLRLIEHEMPRLVAHRKPFIPPTDAPIIVRSLDYAGEEHPATNKRAIVVALDQLGLRDADAIHKIKLLAGPRWTMKPPADSGVPTSEDWGEGYIKISVEDCPTPAMNLKKASDILDRLIAHANDPNANKFRTVPLDLRHIYAKARKAKKGEHLRGRVHNRPTLFDFPQEWLPRMEELPRRRSLMY